MLYRDTTTNKIVTDSELVESVREEIVGLGDDELLKREYDIHGDLAVHDYIVEASLIGYYNRLDGSGIAFRRDSADKVLTADEVEAEFERDVCDLDPDCRAEITFAKWVDQSGYEVEDLPSEVSR